MRRIICTIVASCIVIATGIYASVTAEARTHKISFNETDTSAGIGSSNGQPESAGKASNSHYGGGAFVLRSKQNGLHGTDTYREYFADGSETGNDSYTDTIPNANGVGKITGKGRCVGRTGALRNTRCTYTFTGTYSLKTGRSVGKERGTISS